MGFRRVDFPDGGSGSRRGTLKEPVEAPKDEIFYFKNGDVEAVKTYCVVNGWTVADTSYRRWGNKFFRSSFDEHHAISVSDREISFDELPLRVKDIFVLGNRDGIRKYRELSDSIKGFVDKN